MADAMAMTFEDLDKERVGVAVLPVSVPAASEVEAEAAAAAAAVAAVAAAESGQFLGADEPGAAVAASNASDGATPSDASGRVAAITQEAIRPVAGGGGGEGAMVAVAPGTEGVSARGTEMVF